MTATERLAAAVSSSYSADEAADLMVQFRAEHIAPVLAEVKRLQGVLTAVFEAVVESDMPPATRSRLFRKLQGH